MQLPTVSPPPRPVSWGTSLRYRPLLWLAPAAALGSAAGSLLVAAHCVHTRDSTLLLSPLVVALLAFVTAWQWRHHPVWTRIALFFAVAALFTTHAARRLVPAPDDLAHLVRAVPVPRGPQTRRPVQLEGWVADYPRHSESDVAFPLQCRKVVTGTDGGTVWQGRVWVTAPVEAPVEVGDRISVAAQLADLPRAGNRGERDPQMQLIAEYCWCWAQVSTPAQIHILQEGEAYPVERWAARLRQRLLAHYEAAFAGPSGPLPGRPFPRATAQLLDAMVFGEGGLRDPLPRQTRDQFRIAGLSHVLVASGSQVVWLLAFILLVTRTAGLRRWWLMLIVLPVLLLYVLITGGGSSIWRATISGLCLAIALLLSRDVDGLSLWSLALGTLLAIDPAQLYGLSLQLTFAATWGLLVLAPALQRILDRAVSRSTLTELATLSLGAQLATMPLLLYHFGRLSTAGIGANLLAVPLAGILVGTGVTGLLVPAANAINYPLTRGIAGIAGAAAGLPGAQIETVPLGLPWTVLVYALLALAALVPATGGAVDWSFLRDEWRRWWQRRRARSDTLRPQTVVVAIAVAITGWSLWGTFGRHSPWLHVALLDVGQGECIVVRSAAGRTVMVDAGSSSSSGRGEVGRAVIVPYLQAIGASKIDAVVITHADSDHFNALPAVLRDVPVGMVIDGGWSGDAAAPTEPAGKTVEEAQQAAEYQKVKELLRMRGIPVYPPRAGQQLNLGGGVTLRVLAPLSPRLPGDNNNGAVLRLDYGATSMLLTADIEAEAEERLVRRGVDLHCTVLKLPHHGSKTSTTPLLLDAARPRAAVLSCGRYSQFGHPAEQTLTRLVQRHIPAFRTDSDGEIDIFSDGRACWIQTFR